VIPAKPLPHVHALLPQHAPIVAAMRAAAIDVMSQIAAARDDGDSLLASLKMHFHVVSRARTRRTRATTGLCASERARRRRHRACDHTLLRR